MKKAIFKVSSQSGGVANGLGLRLGPCRCAKDAIAIATIRIASGNFYHFLQETVIQGGGFESKLNEAAIVHD